MGVSIIEYSFMILILLYYGKNQWSLTNSDISLQQRLLLVKINAISIVQTANNNPSDKFKKSTLVFFLVEIR